MNRPELKAALMEIALKPGKSWVCDPERRVDLMLELIWPLLENKSRLQMIRDGVKKAAT